MKTFGPAPAESAATGKYSDQQTGGQPPQGPARHSGFAEHPPHVANENDATDEKIKGQKMNCGTYTVGDVKKFLAGKGISVRL